VVNSIKRRLQEKLGKAPSLKTKKLAAKHPLWKGPLVDGITQSMLSDFLVCRERFRIKYILGLRPVDSFNHRIEYGNMWHLCEEWHAKGSDNWLRALKDYASGLCARYQTQQEQVQHWYNVCKVQFPIYVEHWKKHPDVKNRVPLLQEEVFDVPYELPGSGRVVRLRGKFDSVDLVGVGKSAAIYLQENKAKGDLDEVSLKKQLLFDLQTNIYLIVLHLIQEEANKNGAPDLQEGPIAGVRYNCIRRPLSGGKGSIRKHQPTKKNPKGESDESFYKRLGAIIRDDPGYFFMRWKSEVTPSDLERFKKEFLNPILEQLCDWYDWILKGPGAFEDTWQRGYFNHGIHWRTPYGFYNILAEGGNTELDEYLASGSTLGLERTPALFTELSQ